MSTIKAFLIISLFFFTGCSAFDHSSGYQTYDGRSTGSRSSQYTRTFDDDFEHVWATVIMSLGELPLDKIDKEKWVIKNGWA